MQVQTEILGEVPQLSSTLVTTKPLLIGLTGKARSGKDTVASMLRKTHNTQSVAFASPLKEGLKTMFGLTEEHVNGSLKEVPLEWLGKSPRNLLQTLGTEWGRDCVHQDLWLLLAKRRIAMYMKLGTPVVVTDVRFDNEAEMVRGLGGQVWHIYRKDAPGVAAHASEGGVTFAESDILVYNNGTLEELEELVNEIYNFGA